MSWAEGLARAGAGVAARMARVEPVWHLRRRRSIALIRAEGKRSVSQALDLMNLDLFFAQHTDGDFNLFFFLRSRIRSGFSSGRHELGQFSGFGARAIGTSQEGRGGDG